MKTLNEGWDFKINAEQEKLEKELKEACIGYYHFNCPIISDNTFDKLFLRLKQVYPKSKLVICKNWWKDEKIELKKTKKLLFILAAEKLALE